MEIKKELFCNSRLKVNEISAWVKQCAQIPTDARSPTGCGVVPHVRGASGDQLKQGRLLRVYQLLPHAVTQVIKLLLGATIKTLEREEERVELCFMEDLKNTAKMEGHIK